MHSDVGQGQYFELEVQPHGFVYMMNTGSYQNLTHAFKELERRIAQAGLKVTGLPYSIIMDDPRTVDEDMCRCELGYEMEDIEDKQNEYEGLAVKQITQQFCICTKFCGSIYQLPGVYDQLIAHAESLGYFVAGYPREIYIKHPKFAEKEKVSNVEIQIPVSSY